MTNMHSAAVSGAQKKHIWACQLPLLHSHYLAIHHVELYAKFSESLWALLPHVGKPLIIHRASRSHARKVGKKWFQKWMPNLYDLGAILGA